MSWLTAWFKRSNVDVLKGIALTALKLFLGTASQGIWERINDSVWRAEHTGKPGAEKFEMVYGEIRAAVTDPKLYKWLLRAAIEVAVGILQAQKGELG